MVARTAAEYNRRRWPASESGNIMCLLVFPFPHIIYRAPSSRAMGRTLGYRARQISIALRSVNEQPQKKMLNGRSGARRSIFYATGISIDCSCGGARGSAWRWPPPDKYGGGAYHLRRRCAVAEKYRAPAAAFSMRRRRRRCVSKK